MKASTLLIAMILVTLVLGSVWYTAPVKTVCISPKDVVHNYAFAGRVVLKDGSDYYVGTELAVKLWLSKDDVVYSYKFIK